MRGLIVAFLLSMVQLVAFPSQVSLLVDVRDDLGRPISNAVVSVKTLNRLAIGYGTRPSHFLWASNRTDETGTSMVCFDCLTADFACYVSSENHYPEKNLKGRYLARENSSLGMDILSPVTNMSFVLRRRIMPVPMYTFGALSKYGMPSKEGVWGFDLKKGDWVRPWGRGETEDFKVEYHLTQTNNNILCFGSVVFEEDGSGGYILPKVKSGMLQSSYAVDTNATFRTRFDFSARVNLSNPHDNERRDVLGEDEYLVIRSRVKVDVRGRVVSANYSKIYGPFKIGDELFFSQSSFNPEVNDPNLEFDVKRNLNRRTHNAVRP